MSRQSHADTAHPDDFNGMVVSLGALGIVTRVTLRVEPAFDVAQTVFDDVPLDAVLAHYDEVTSTGYSVTASCPGPATGAGVGKERVRAVRTGSNPCGELLGRRRPTDHGIPCRAWRPRRRPSRRECPGRGSNGCRTSDSRSSRSAGDEIQSEYLVPRDRAVEALEAVRRLGPRIAPLLFISELRTMAADDLWLSGAYGRATAGIHFTWHPDPAGVLAVLPNSRRRSRRLGPGRTGESFRVGRCRPGAALPAVERLRGPRPPVGSRGQVPQPVPHRARVRLSPCSAEPAGAQLAGTQL